MTKSHLVYVCEQSLFPLRDSREKAKKQASAKSPGMLNHGLTPTADDSTQQAIFALVHLFGSLDYCQVQKVVMW